MTLLQSKHDGYVYFEAARKASDYIGCYPGWVGVIIGNGESRLPYDLWRIRSELPKALLVACNSYYHDVDQGVQPLPHFLGAVDPVIAREIMCSGYADRYPFLVNPISLEWYQNERWNANGGDPGLMPRPANLIQLDWRVDYNCGVEMAHFAMRVGCRAVVLLGFDGPTDDEEVVNNVYKGYPGCAATAWSPSPGRDQMRNMRRKWPSVPFYQVDTSWIRDADTISFGAMFNLELVGERV
jgi:hypothetical protein